MLYFQNVKFEKKWVLLFLFRNVDNQVRDKLQTGTSARLAPDFRHYSSRWSEWRKSRGRKITTLRNFVIFPTETAMAASTVKVTQNTAMLDSMKSQRKFLLQANRRKAIKTQNSSRSGFHVHHFKTV